MATSTTPRRPRRRSRTVGSGPEISVSSMTSATSRSWAERRRSCGPAARACRLRKSKACCATRLALPRSRSSGFPIPIGARFYALQSSPEKVRRLRLLACRPIAKVVSPASRSPADSRSSANSRARRRPHRCSAPCWSSRFSRRVRRSVELASWVDRQHDDREPRLFQLDENFAIGFFAHVVGPFRRALRNRNGVAFGWNLAYEEGDVALIL